MSGRSLEVAPHSFLSSAHGVCSHSGLRSWSSVLLALGLSQGPARSAPRQRSTLSGRDEACPPGGFPPAGRCQRVAEAGSVQ